MKNYVKIVEVGPRDGLQNEKGIIDLETKVELINKLSQTGLRVVEAGAFVSPEYVPQMAGSGQVLQKINQKKHVAYPVLVPNERGMNDAVKAGAKEVAVFASASEGFSRANINCSIEESYERFAPVFNMANENGIPVRAYVSCVIACPYDGPILPTQAADVAKHLLDMGAYEISLGDTIGIGFPDEVEALLKACFNIAVGAEKWALHLHDTYGRALENIERGLKMGIRTFDSSVGGLGGCPYAKGATGNVATEEVLALLHGKGYETGVDEKTIKQTARWIKAKLNK